MSASARSVLRPLIGPVYAPTLAQAVGMTATLPVIPLIALALGFPVPAAAALTLITGVVGVLGPIPLGAAMTAVGERRAMVVTGVAVTCTQIGTLAMVEHARITGPTPWHQAGLIVSLVVSSLSREVWIIGRQAYLGTALPPELRARGMSTFGGMMRIGQVIGPLLGAGIIVLGDEGWVIGLDAAAMAAATLMVALTMLPGEHAAKRPSMRQAVGRIPVVPSPQAPHRTAGVTMVLAGFATVPLTMSRISRPLIFPLLGAMLGLRGDEISLIFAIAAVVEIVMFVPAGTLMDRYGRAAVLVPCLIFSGAGYLLLVVLAATLAEGSRAGAFWALAASAALVAFGNGFGAGIVMTLGIDLAPEAHRTRHLARWNTVNGTGRLLAPGIVALVTLAWPISAAGAVVGGLCWAGAVWAWWLMPQITPGRAGGPARRTPRRSPGSDGRSPTTPPPRSRG